MKKILIAIGILLSIGVSVYADPSVKVFTSETVAGALGSTAEVSTSTGYNIDGITDIGYDYFITQGTSTPHISIGYQTSMNKATWTATILATTDTSAVVYTATQTAVTVAPTEWIRWILKTEKDNATNTSMDLFFKAKNEGEK
jgi:hypothetical protein